MSSPSSWLSFAVLCKLLWISAGFLLPLARPVDQNNVGPMFSSSSVSADALMGNLTTALDKWILTGSVARKQQAYHFLEKLETCGSEVYQSAVRKARSAGLPAENKELGADDSNTRINLAKERQAFEQNQQHRSVLTSRKPDLFSLDPSLDRTEQLADEKLELSQALQNNNETTVTLDDGPDDSKAIELISRIVASEAGVFDGEHLGIGGLDDVLDIIKRRVWTPLAVPPQLLAELGIQPVRGILLYGKPGCGKTLLARRLGQLLSPLRPSSIISGPEIMDKFVGSSEKNLRAVFDEPPDIYDVYKEHNMGEALSRTALHVIIMDEFDAIARHRGGKGGSGDQGDAGVARDSVVNQLLAKMDGVAPLVVPTLVIGLTNKRSLIDGALLRPGRFEVHIEVPPPKTVEQRASILRVHTKHMYEAGRLLVSDAPIGSAAALLSTEITPSYGELLDEFAKETEDFTGASLAAMARAAASHALERAVDDYAHTNGVSLLETCVVTAEDFAFAKHDIDAVGDTDYNESHEEGEESFVEDRSEPNKSKGEIGKD